MDRLNIENWIACLGLPYAELLSKSLISEGALIELFPGIDELYLELETGVSISFWEATRCLESLYITLIPVVEGEGEYSGTLPAPFSSQMNKSKVRALFGQPLASSGPFKMPDPVGQVGGWDYFILNAKTHPNIKVQFQYLESMDVNAIVFTLIDKGHD